MRDDLDLNVFKILLEKRLAEIMAGREAQQREGAPVELDQTKVGRLSRMDAMQQQAMAQASSRRTEVELQRIRTAVNRLRSGDYGYCVKCDEEIAEKRLKVDPATLVCIECARAAEGKAGR
ncbi:MAG: TraR/DksA C4-type zinc finger protein [Desulfuromonadaceae bacterium]|nr:TraR/DksA C4-type zinc finger protein [Desulfuromonadaceae bacterium]